MINRAFSQMIFMTGLPRSGTTWAGNVIAAATGSAIIEEPFNWKWHPDRRHYHMQYLPAGVTDTDYVDVLLKTVISLKRPRRSLRVLLSRRVVVRDVLTCLAIEHVWERLQPLTIIMVRHPCAVAHSWARVGFKVDYRLDILLSQPRLLDEHLHPYQVHLKSSENFYFQLGAYWGATHYVLRRIAAKYPAWQWITHEALCIQLEAGFEDLLARFGLTMRQPGYSLLRASNRQRQPGEGDFSIARLSADEPEKWKRQLTPAQITAVLAGAEPFGVLEPFFPE